MKVANENFRGDDDHLLLLEIDPTSIAPTIRYENLEGGEELFPHIYGALNRDAVVGVHHLVAGPSGEFSSPAALSKWF